MRADQQALDFDFLPLFGATAEGLERDFVNPVPEDREAANAERTSKATAAELYREAGFTGDSVKTALELPDTLVWREPPAEPIPVIAPPRAAVATTAGLLAQLRAQVDPEATREDRVDSVLSDWEEVSDAQRAELLEQSRQAVAGATPVDLATLSADGSVGAMLLEAALIEQAQAAGQRMVESADEQGVAISAAEVAGVLAATLTATAAVTAALLAASLAVSAGRAALRAWAPGVTEDRWLSGCVSTWRACGTRSCGRSCAARSGQRVSGSGDTQRPARSPGNGHGAGRGAGRVDRLDDRLGRGSAGHEPEFDAQIAAVRQLRAWLISKGLGKAVRAPRLHLHELPGRSASRRARPAGPAGRRRCARRPNRIGDRRHHGPLRSQRGAGGGAAVNLDGRRPTVPL